ncbi:Cys-tRNA(Pro) deacylase [Crystallibacter degradans]|uniref:Cys-tRNA(Pro) deacylase n=1 Tax=Crystallibacter degradans TaxID=2726743 RepID=UPI001475EEA6|nr:Cys-tRNA(Pro) deacylase [Arthrobacter sp. SF27]NMR30210.1 Cys-tRNA(Pro) deacylase [Arthrobacter sp. SF27]
MAKRTASTGTPATLLLQQAGVPHTLHKYAHDPAVSDFGLEAARKLGLAPERIFKTLMVTADGNLAVAVVPVSGNLNLKSFAASLGAKKSVLADPLDAQRRTGYVLGGISPLGQRYRSPTILDSSAIDYPTILVSGGRRGLDIELAPQDLIRLSGARLAAIGTG